MCLYSGKAYAFSVRSCAGLLTSEQFDEWVRPEEMVGPK